MVIKIRGPWRAFLFTLLGAGFGYLYVGNLRCALLSFALQFLIMCGALATGMLDEPKGLYLTIAALIMLVLFAAIHSMRIARRIGSSNLKWYQRWYYYFAILMIHAFFYPDLHDSYAMFRVPSESSMPAIIPGDYIMVSKLAYGESDPHRGDLVVYVNPDPIELQGRGVRIVKRIVGVAGDSIEVKGLEVFINGKKLEEPYARYLEGGLSADVGPLTVPANSYFMLGDNRDRSRDSRHYKSHFVNKHLIVGKVLYIYWSFPHFERTGKKLNL